MTSSKNSKLLAIAAALIVILLGVTAFLGYNNTKKEQLLTQSEAETLEAEKLKAELEKQYYEALAELEEMRGSNEELNALIDAQKEELKSEKNRVATLIRDGKASKNALATARKEIDALKKRTEELIAEVTTLKESNEMLTQQNTQLAGERDNLLQEVEQERMTNEELTTAKAALVSEKESLETEKAELSRKVSVASVIKVDDISATGWKIRKSGKSVKKKYAKNIDRLTLCFNTTTNEVVEPGLEQFHIRIINPLGETLAVEELGSGVLTSTASDEQIRYTQAKEFEYNRNAENLCINWEPNIPFQKGNYEVQIYNKGYLAGQGTFSLK